MSDDLGGYALRVHDLKQFEYCPRIVFYNTVLPVERKGTVKMERGAEVELRVDALEARRSLRRYRLGSGERQWRVSIRSERLGLSGQIDMLIETADAAYAVDFKYTRDRPRPNHLLQLAAYAMLIEDCLGRPSPAGFIYLVPQEQIVRVRSSPELRQRVTAALAEIRRMIGDHLFPPPTPVRARCADCEFRNYCGDVF